MIINRRDTYRSKADRVLGKHFPSPPPTVGLRIHATPNLPTNQPSSAVIHCLPKCNCATSLFIAVSLLPRDSIVRRCCCPTVDPFWLLRALRLLNRQLLKLQSRGLSFLPSPGTTRLSAASCATSRTTLAPAECQGPAASSDPLENPLASVSIQVSRLADMQDVCTA